MGTDHLSHLSPGDQTTRARFCPMKHDPADARLWIINRLAETLVDLAEDDEDDAVVDLEELTDQMRNVAEILIESINLVVTGSDGTTGTAEFGDG